jgi:hypothetical protein
MAGRGTIVREFGSAAANLQQGCFTAAVAMFRTAKGRM